MYLSLTRIRIITSPNQDWWLSKGHFLYFILKPRTLKCSTPSLLLIQLHNATLLTSNKGVASKRNCLFIYVLMTAAYNWYWRRWNDAGRFRSRKAVNEHFKGVHARLQWLTSVEMLMQRDMGSFSSSVCVLAKDWESMCVCSWPKQDRSPLLERRLSSHAKMSTSRKMNWRRVR